jgi:hypothetical protein
LPVDDGIHGSIFVQRSCIGRHIHRVAHLADLKLDSEHALIADIQDDIS